MLNEFRESDLSTLFFTSTCHLGNPILHDMIL
nr:MAG TPA: hypothetical protein [Caudoviricetes sp.]